MQHPHPLIHPLIHQVHARQWLAALSARAGRRLDLAAVPDAELDAWRDRGVTHAWVMGVWPTGPLSRAEALRHEGLRREYDALLPGWAEADVAGSPFAIAGTEVAADLGGDAALAALRERLRARGIGLILDFIPNHLGLDHPWVRERPERFVREAGSGAVAHGKDPYFPPWTDTAQLDYRRPETRAAMVEVLRGIAARCDGVRCDMAMLVLPDVFERTWGPLPGAPAPAEGEGFWPAAIAAVRREWPGFLFIAEAYWGLERRLQALGFDFTYDKTLSDHLAHRKPYAVPLHLHDAGADYVRRGVHFLENHDEPRAAATFDPLEHRPAALLALGLPGARLLHEGQLEGARRFSRIQLGRRPEEPRDGEVAVFYEVALAALRRSAVGRGVAEVLRPEPAWEGNPTHGCIAAVQWQAQEPAAAPAFDLVVANLAPHRSQCRVRLTAAGLEGRFAMADALGPERYERDGGEMRTPGLWLDLAPHAAHLYRFERR